MQRWANAEHATVLSIAIWGTNMMSEEEQTNEWGDLIEVGVERSPHVTVPCPCGFVAIQYTQSDIEYFNRVKAKVECPACRKPLNTSQSE